MHRPRNVQEFKGSVALIVAIAAAAAAIFAEYLKRRP